MFVHLPDCLIPYQQRINSVLDCRLPCSKHLLHQAMRYAVLGGGKRLRATLTYGTGELFSASGSTLDTCAAAIELVHAYSLIHDDLPAMDNDDMRHGQPSCHRAFGEAIAILAGDALQSLAFEWLAMECAERSLAMIHVLAQAIGAQGMVDGQALDVAENRISSLEALEAMHQKKTGALMVASVQLGMLAGHSPDLQQSNALITFASKLGLAFQIWDDILNVEGSTAVLGKTQGSDAAHHKATYPALLGLEGSRQRARDLHDEALACLAAARLCAPVLSALATFAITRQN